MAEAVLVDNGSGHWLLQGELGFDSVSSVLQHAGANMLGNGHREVVEILIRNDADPSLRSASGETSIDIAQRKGQKHCVSKAG